MKRVFIIIFIYLLTNKISAQYTPQDAPLIEIFTIVINGSQQETYSATLTSFGTVWDVKNISSTQRSYLIGSGHGGTVNITPDVGTSDYVGFNFMVANDHSFPEFGFGLYKLSFNTGLYFYLDYRDCNYGYYSAAPLHSADIWVVYDDQLNEVEIFHHDQSTWSLGSGISVSNGDYMSIWDLKQVGNPNTEPISDFWSYSPLVPFISSEDHPYLVWSAYPASNILYYIIERNDTYTGWEIAGTTTSLSYLDEDVNIHPVFEDNVQYRIKAKLNSITISEPSNTVFYDNTVLHKERIFSYQKKNKLDNYKLFDTYPNPFNPVTNIPTVCHRMDLFLLKFTIV